MISFHYQVSRITITISIRTATIACLVESLWFSRFAVSFSTFSPSLANEEDLFALAFYHSRVSESQGDCSYILMLVNEMLECTLRSLQAGGGTFIQNSCGFVYYHFYVFVKAC